MSSLSKTQASELASLMATKLTLRKSINALNKAGLDASKLETDLKDVQYTIDTY